MQPQPSSAHMLITGATGFLGSALASEFLRAGYLVTAVSRNDPEGMRTRTAIESARSGFELPPLGESEFMRLRVIQTPDDRFEESGWIDRLEPIDQVWHVAAEMSYAAHSLGDSFATNVGNTVRLYRACARRATAPTRFHYVSTAYVAGQPGRRVQEEMHIAPSISNSYQVSKWAAEHALEAAQSRDGVPVSIIRPTIVVGHRRTGWTRRNGFGFYMFLEGLMHLPRTGQLMHMDLLTAPRPDLISIDDLIEDALLLASRPGHSGQDFEVLHFSGGLGLSTGELMQLWSHATGVDTVPGVPQSQDERRLDRLIGPNKRFARSEWEFVRSRTDMATRRSSARPVLSRTELQRMCDWYVRHVAAEQDQKEEKEGVAA